MKTKQVLASLFITIGKVSVEMKKWNLSFDDLANIRKGEIAKVFGQGGGTQIQFGTSVSVYELLGLLREFWKIFI